MDISKARELFQLGHVTGFRAEPAVMGSGWVLVLELDRKAGVREQPLHTARGDVRVFSSLDTMAGQVQAIAGQLKGLTFRIV